MDLSKITMYQACLLHSKSERVLKNLVAKVLEEWEVTRMEWLLLASVGTVAKNPAGHTMTELAILMDVKMSQLTALMTRMTEAKLIDQNQSGDDRRTRYVKLTRRGRKLLEEIEVGLRSAMRSWLGKIPLSRLSVYMQTVKELGEI